jgi:hypothetical protein
VANSQVNEDNGSLTVTVIRSGGHQGAVTVTYATQDDTAKVNQDYQPATGTLRWADGEAGPKQFIVGLLDDTLVEDLKTFHITLTNPTGGAQLGQVATTVVTINDNDVATLQFSLSNYMVAKNSAEALITVTRVGSNIGDLTVTYDTVDDTAKAGQDYTTQNGTLTWPNGDSTAKTFAIPLLYSNTTAEGSNKTFQVQLATATGRAALGTPKEATVTIAEDDLSGCQLAPVIDCYLNNTTNVVPVKDIKITTRGTVVGGILGGTLQNAGTIQDVTLLTNTVIYGGTVGGTLKGTALPDRPDFNEVLATLSEVKILPKSNLQQVIIGRGCVLDNTVVLGAGVLFEDNSTIPYGIDLNQAYSHTVMPLTPVFGQRGIWLGDDVLRYSAIGGMLGAINSLYALTSQNLVLTQHPRYGYLMVNVNQVRYAVLPLRLRQIINTQRSEEQTPSGMTLSPEGTVTFVTHTGREVTAYPVIQNPDALQEALRNWGLTVDMQADGNLKVPTTNGTYYIARPSIYSTPVSKDVPVGLTVTPPVSLIFDDDTETRRQQLIYPAAANSDALREADNNTVLGNDGRLTLRVGNRFYQGMLDYLVTSGTRTSDGQLQVLDLGDVNEDGLTDYQIIYPNGVKQMMFGM